MIRRALLPLIASLFFAAAPAAAQETNPDFVGLYDGGQMEVGAALELSADGRFRYFMTYGAIDEGAAGTWSTSGESIVLHSDPVNAPAFALVGSKKGRGSAFDIGLELPGQMQPQFFSAVVSFADGSGANEDFDGPQLRLKLAKGQTVTGVVLQLPIYDVASTKFDVPAGTKAMNFRFAPNDLGTVAFTDTVLVPEGGAYLLGRYDRVLKFRKQEYEEQAKEPDPPPTDPAEILPQVVGPWAYTGQDCDPDNHFEPPANMPGARLELLPDYTYRLTTLGKETQGSFTIEVSEYLSGELFAVKLEQAQLTYVLNIDRLESWGETPVEQCTQLFERPQ